MLPERVGGHTRINQPENLFSLTPTYHGLYRQGSFALEPLGDSLIRLRKDTDALDSYDVQFSWLPQHRPRGEEHMKK